ncbi:hypothetical protein PWT90_05919 [Aphanocladium album]|nr:hypothetical protein PWT90_05919 [Aphanocladium album]
MDQFLSSPVALSKIGQGFCGTVWAEDASESVVLKRADGGPGRSLPNEQFIHTLILRSIERYRLVNECNKTEKNKRKNDSSLNGKNDSDSGDEIMIHIPFNAAFLSPESALWNQLLPRLPAGFSACEGLISERIPPMPLDVRELLASHYCPNTQLATQVAQDKSNESCLVRPYLGRRRPEQRGGPKQRFFSLRNFPLHIDQMDELNLPSDEYAIAMADALAFLHWTAKVDAGDVEYVLAPPRALPNSSASIGSRTLPSAAFGIHAIWILDFDCCKELEMTEAGMRRAAQCFWRNDPFYPRPGAKNAKDQRMWELFKERFIQRSNILLSRENEQVKKLPELLVQVIIDNRDTWTKGAIN